MSNQLDIPEGISKQAQDLLVRVSYSMFYFQFSCWSATLINVWDHLVAARK